ncbi:MAG: DUF3526 domain-containing protein [Pseudomonadota bacterium]
MRRALVVAGGELRLLLRSRLAAIGLGALLALSAVAAWTSSAHVAREHATRAAHQAAVDRLFDDQPARHPHRVVHYGTYAHRPLGPLAAFDPGVDPYTGTTLYLEGHRQNVAAFGAARESSGLLRFGQLTPAFVLQTLAPLLLVFLGYASVARERESGGLRQLYSHGARAVDVLAGKALALGAVALAVALPAGIALVAAAASVPAEVPAALAVAAGHLLYLAAWVLAIAAISAFAGTARTALVALVAAWTVAVVVLPRVAAEYALRAEPLPSRVETDLRLQAELRELGDSHDANDPFFAEFRRRTLERYGVERIEDLPVNFRGLVSAEGETLTSRLFVEYAERLAAIQRAQRARVDAFAWATPALAVRRASMTAAGSDLENHLRFLAQAEAYRYDLIQRLNRLHADGVAYADDVQRSRDAAAERRTRVVASHWQQLPDFRFEPASPGERLAAARSALLALGGWVAALIGVLALAARRLERTA